ncbi:dihydrofolate reductase family protein [Microtetraspora fusca]|uniref:dihydrofolate reductase family protein n=1 Tax=Microtetraspora fusca TaxID=1997 RepID=UPI00082BBDF9|nr:dihydrofolate reductase family protein [Microtetraspora fusca]
MRKIVAAFFISLDGVVESPDKWHFPYFNDEMGAAIGAQMSESDAMMMGRVMYEDWAAYWPGKTEADDPFAPFINNIQKYVVSSTLDKVEWQNCTLVSGDFVEEITKLKQEPGKSISISGSTTLVRSLMRHGLLDELRLLVHPIVVGTGQRLFEEGVQIPMKLTSSTTFETGVLSLVYQPAEN